MIIDFHTHIGTSRSAFYEEQGEKAFLEICKNPNALTAYMQTSNIDKSVVFSSPMLPHKQKEANDEVLQMISGYEALIPFAFLDPRLEESPRLLEELVERGCKGLKLHPICHGYVVSNSMCYPTIEIACSLEIPIITHTGWGEYGEIRWVEKLAKDFPNLRVVIGHLIEQKDVFTIIPPLENVSVETSYATHPRRISQAVSSLGADRVVFGSDFPCTHPGFELYKVMQAPILEADREKILYKNAQELLKIE